MISNPTAKMAVRRHPYAFTEQGVAMLSSVLRSDRAVQVNIETVGCISMHLPVVRHERQTVYQRSKKFIKMNHTGLHHPWWCWMAAKRSSAVSACATLARKPSVCHIRLMLANA